MEWKPELDVYHTEDWVLWMWAYRRREFIQKYLSDNDIDLLGRVFREYEVYRCARGLANSCISRQKELEAKMIHTLVFESQRPCSAETQQKYDRCRADCAAVLAKRNMRRKKWLESVLSLDP